MTVHETYMARCLHLAQLGMEHVAPNPMVGAVVVHNGTVIAEGYHKRYGTLHAEASAIAAVENQELLKESTLYVSLEPCSHYGKTPPCAELILKKRIPRVVVGMLDPFPLVAGRGVKMLQEGGVGVTVGVLEAECRTLNKRFICFQEQKRPYIILKWAQTADGYLDGVRSSVNEPVEIISNELTKQLTHKMRAENMAIMVGTRTALLDNPSLRTTRWSGNNPIRITIDKELQIPAHYNLLQNQAPTLVFSERSAYPFETGAEVIPIRFDENSWPTMLHEMYKRNIHSVIVEGGARLHYTILMSGVWDELQIETAPKTIGVGVEAVKVNLQPQSVTHWNGHRIATFYHP